MKSASHPAAPKHYTALSRETGPAITTAPEEPVLDIHDIQGNTIPGFNKPHQYILCFTIEEAGQAKQFLCEMLPHISTLEEVLAFRRLYRARKKRLGYKPKGELNATWLNIAFSYPGVCKLTTDNQFESEPFKIGLADRSPLLGDPTDPNNKGCPLNWIVGNKGKIPDTLILIGGDRQDDVREKVALVKQQAQNCHLALIYEEEMNTIESDDGITGQEHFGFKDGISQPGVRGRLSHQATDYLQERYVDAGVLPDSLLYGYPGQFLSWPGEFVFGYPGQTLDPLVAGTIKREGPNWTKNGSFLVFRRYRQDVKMFWKYMHDTARHLLKQDPNAFDGMTPEKLAAMLIGRWRTGAPFARIQDENDPSLKTLGSDQMANNYFRYASDSCPVSLVNGHQDTYPQAKADPIGLTCPMISHIRKVNTRDASNDAGGTLASFQQRLLRRGLPFGPRLLNPLDEHQTDPVNGNRGLLFLSYQTSIENQFEFLRNRWMSNRFSPRNPGGDDMAIGLNGNVGEGRKREGILFGKGGDTTASLSTADQWITPTGGGYFFSPSISAIKEVLAV